MSYIRRLAAGSTTLGGRHFMKEGVYFPHRDCVGMSFESKKKNAASAHLSQLPWGSGTLLQSPVPACNNQRSLSSCPKPSLTGCSLACDEVACVPRASSLVGSRAPPRHFLKMGSHPMTWSARTSQMKARLLGGRVALQLVSPTQLFPPAGSGVTRSMWYVFRKVPSLRSLSTPC